MRHEDAEVVAQVRARDAEGPHRTADQHVAGDDQRVGHQARGGRLHRRVGGLGAQGALEEAVADDAQEEDHGAEEVACQEGVAAEEAGEGFVVVFWDAGELDVFACVSAAGCVGGKGVPCRAAMLDVRLAGGGGRVWGWGNRDILPKYGVECD